MKGREHSKDCYSQKFDRFYTLSSSMQVAVHLDSNWLLCPMFRGVNEPNSS